MSSKHYMFTVPLSSLFPWCLPSTHTLWLSSFQPQCIIFPHSSCHSLVVLSFFNIFVSFSFLIPSVFLCRLLALLFPLLLFCALSSSSAIFYHSFPHQLTFFPAEWHILSFPYCQCMSAIFWYAWHFYSIYSMMFLWAKENTVYRENLRKELLIRNWRKDSL